MTEAASARAPWHLWVVGVIALLWNGFGCYDYVMTQVGGEAYLRSYGMTEAQIAYYSAMPAWTMAAWAIGVWGALVGAALLLLRSKWSFHAFAASLAAFLISVVYTYALSGGLAMSGTEGIILNGVIAAGAIFFLWYAWAMSKAGVLR